MVDEPPTPHQIVQDIVHSNGSAGLRQADILRDIQRLQQKRKTETPQLDSMVSKRQKIKQMRERRIDTVSAAKFAVQKTLSELKERQAKLSDAIHAEQMMAQEEDEFIRSSLFQSVVTEIDQDLANSLKEAVAEDAKGTLVMNESIASKFLFNMKTSVQLCQLDDFSEHPLLFTFLGFLFKVSLSSLQDIVLVACNSRSLTTTCEDPFFLNHEYLKTLLDFVGLEVPNMWTAVFMGRTMENKFNHLDDIPVDAPFHWGVFRQWLSDKTMTFHDMKTRFDAQKKLYEDQDQL